MPMLPGLQVQATAAGLFCCARLLCKQGGESIISVPLLQAQEEAPRLQFGEM